MKICQTIASVAFIETEFRAMSDCKQHKLSQPEIQTKAAETCRETVKANCCLAYVFNLSICTRRDVKEHVFKYRRVPPQLLLLSMGMLWRC